jgi:hypothetical protein
MSMSSSLISATSVRLVSPRNYDFLPECTGVGEGLAHDFGEIFWNFVDKGLEAGGVDVDVSYLFFLGRVGNIGDKLFADLTDEGFGDLGDDFCKALDGVTYGGEGGG